MLTPTAGRVESVPSHLMVSVCHVSWPILLGGSAVWAFLISRLLICELFEKNYSAVSLNSFILYLLRFRSACARVPCDSVYREEESRPTLQPLVLAVWRYVRLGLPRLLRVTGDVTVDHASPWERSMVFETECPLRLAATCPPKLYLAH